MAAPPRAGATPLLANGDRLTREEFERRYEAMPEVKKAELIEGVVYLPSPVTCGKHGDPHFDLITWLGAYRVATPGVRGGDNTTVRLDWDSVPQPDALLRIDAAFGGQARVDEDDYVEGAPELVAEVAASSWSYDLHDKMDAYCRAGVREYIVWRVLDEAVDWFVLEAGRYVRLALDASGLCRSQVLPGLWLDPVALAGRDMPAVMQHLQAGLASEEHTGFVNRLKLVGAAESAPGG